MTDKELRRCSRRELIEILYFVRKELDDVKAENEVLRTRLDTILGQALAAKGISPEESPSDEEKS